MATSPSNLPERPASAGSSPKFSSVPTVNSSSIVVNGHAVANFPSTTPTSSGQQSQLMCNGNAKFTVVKASEAYPRPAGALQSSNSSSDSQNVKVSMSMKNEGVLQTHESDPATNYDLPKFLFDEIPGEWTTRIALTRDGHVALSNYRLHVSLSGGSQENDGGEVGMNVPLGCIESVEQRDLFYLDVNCKDGRYYRIRFEDNSSCEEWQKFVCEAIAPPEKIQDVFAFGHRAWAAEKGM